MLYKKSDSQIWWSDLRHNGRRIRQTTGELDKSKAQERENEFQITLWRAGPAVKGNTWSQAVTKWVSVEPRSDSELYSLVKFSNHFADRALADITPDDIATALAFCKTASTHTRYNNMIAAILKLSGIKLALVKRKDKKTKPREWITHEQWKKLRALLPPHLKAMATFAIETGLRQANVLGLEWSRVDLERKVVWVEGEDTKSDKPIRVPLNERALAVLVSQAALPLYKKASGPSPFVFLFRGRPVKRVKTSFNAACIKAGVPDFTWHGLRHTWATWHVQHGTPIEVLKDLGGWSDLRMVMNYAHHAPSHIASYADNTKPKPKAKTQNNPTRAPQKTTGRCSKTATARA